ncbi:hypothetical protein ACQKWADRAFT_307020 [Trichoderma austrokoningii]
MQHRETHRTYPGLWATKSDDQIYEQDLDDTALLSSVFKNISPSITHPDVKWTEFLPDRIQESIDPNIRRLLAPPGSMYYEARIVQIYRSPALILLRQAGDLIPLRACEGCYVRDEEISHPLHYGKVMHLPLWQRISYRFI